jgi:hypothetical protein
MLISTVSILVLFWNFYFVQSEHFYGGTVTWKPMITNTTDSTIPIMFIQSYQWKLSWTNSHGAGTAYCDQTIILNQSPKIPGTTYTLTCVSSGSCGGYTDISINEYCTDFSTLVDSSSGQISTVQNITAGSSFCVAFQAGSWTTVMSTQCLSGRKKRERSKRQSTLTQTGCFSSMADWSVGCCVDLTVRPDGFINTPPVATIISRMYMSEFLSTRYFRAKSIF